MTCPSFSSHDHGRCRATALAEAERHCTDHGLRLTPARRRVLEALLDAPKAQGAYDLLGRMNEGGAHHQPPAVYRALDFLTAHGFAHRIERLNAYVACTAPGEAHDPAFLICRACDRVSESDGATPRPLDRSARSAGFVIEGTVIEATGLCPDCAPGPSE